MSQINFLFQVAFTGYLIRKSKVGLLICSISTGAGGGVFHVNKSREINPEGMQEVVQEAGVCTVAGASDG